MREFQRGLISVQPSKIRFPLPGKTGKEQPGGEIQLKDSSTDGKMVMCI